MSDDNLPDTISSYDIYLPRSVYHTIKNLAENYVSVIDDENYTDIPYRLTFTKEFPVMISLDEEGFNEYINKDLGSFDLAYATEIAEDLAESVVLFKDIYLKEADLNLLKENEKNEIDTRLSYALEPSLEYNLQLRARDVERKTEDGKYIAYNWYGESNLVQSVDKEILDSYENARKQKELEKQKAEKLRLEHEKEQERKKQKIKEEQIRLELQEKQDNTFLETYSLENLLAHDSTQESINDLKESVSQPRVLVYTTLNNADVFYDESGKFISLIYDNDASFRSEYQSGLFAHFGVDVVNFSLPRLLEKKLEQFDEEYGDTNEAVDQFITPYVQSVLSRK